MRRLYLQIYLTFVGILLLFGALVSVAWWLTPGDGQDRAFARWRGRAAWPKCLPAADRPAAGAGRRRSTGWRSSSTPTSRCARTTARWWRMQETRCRLFPPIAPAAAGYARSRGPMIALSLPDGRWVLARWHRHHRAMGWLGALLLLAAAIAIGAYPLVRRITGRLERLQARVDALGAGDLAARVQVEGCDEVAELARSFNRAAERIQRLVNAQKTVLAGASHELRSPLTRMRMAVELLPGEERPELRAQLSKDIGELDELIGELLLASRLDALDQPRSTPKRSTCSRCWPKRRRAPVPR